MEMGKDYKHFFIGYFDDSYELNQPSTFQMGVGKLEYVEETNTLHIHLRRPGILIGRQGRTIDQFKKSIDCNVEIHEIDLLK